MLAKTESVALIGTEARIVEVEVHVGSGVPAFRIVGLPAKSVTEAEQRTRAALLSSDQRWPPHRITANLAPGALRKEGTHFDLPIALGVLAADGYLDGSRLAEFVSVGELALDGSVRAIRGALAAAIEVHRQGQRGLICPAANAPEAAVVEGLDVIPVATLREAIDFLKGTLTPLAVMPSGRDAEPVYEDLDEVRGQSHAKEGLEVAAAGGHNVLLVGPPGSGKTMLAGRLPGILPEMSTDESFEVTSLYSIAGMLPERASLIRVRPFRAPHQHVSVAGLIGGGTGLARPGEASLADRGVLFLDELSLFRRDVLESLRAPLEEGVVRIARSGGVVTFPAHFSLVAATNPCPCGFLDDERRACSCTAKQLANHRSVLSGPLLDRIDIQVAVDAVSRAELMSRERGEPSSAVRERVEKARLMQAERYGRHTVTNASARRRELYDSLELAPQAHDLVGDAIDSMMLSGRGVVRSMRVARTIADLEGSGSVTADHVRRALNFRLISKQEVDR